MEYDYFNPDPFSAHAKLVEQTGHNKVVLEVGCATGYISQRLQANGCKVYGIELDPQAAQLARPYCEEIIVVDLEQLDSLPFAKQFFDVILLADVLEHLRSPATQLQRLISHLKPGGLVIIDLPNIANLSTRWMMLTGRFDYTHTGIMDRTHLRFFTKRSALELLNKTGLELVSIDVNQGIDQIGILRATLLKVLRRTPWYYSILYRLTKLWPEGLALQFLLVATKPPLDAQPTIDGQSSMMQSQSNPPSNPPVG